MEVKPLNVYSKMFRVGATITPFMYFLYSLAIVCYAVLVAPRVIYAAVRHRKYIGSLVERCGQLPVAINPKREISIWVHAVSVGEVLAVRALVPALRDRYPNHRLWMSTTTKTGREVASTLKGVDGLFYFPLDLPPFVKRVLDQVRPELFLMVETELWPNLLRHCGRRGVKTVLVNGRISDRSYPRYRLVRRFLTRVFQEVDCCCAQSEIASDRLISLGAAPQHVTVTGNLKFDAWVEFSAGDSGNPDGILRAFRMATNRPILIAASTHPGEEAFVLDAFSRVKQRDPQVLLVIAPRHPERSEDVMAMCLGGGFKAIRRSELPHHEQAEADVVVLDTVGELATLFQIATVVFLGGSLVPSGGHNVLEPAFWGKPVVFGPYMSNFAEIAELFLENSAARQIESPEELEVALWDLLSDSARSEALGAAASALVVTQRGATERSLAEIAAVFPPNSEASGGC